jgi:hypothetical protein
MPLGSVIDSAMPHLPIGSARWPAHTETGQSGVVAVDQTDDRRAFMSVVRRTAKPFMGTGWQLGASGLRRQAATEHWAHFWFLGSSFNRPLVLRPVAGTVSPYLLRTFNRQRTDRPPHANFIAVHSRLGPPERELVFANTTGGVPAEVDRDATRRVIDEGSLAVWLEARLPEFLPRLEALSSDRALLDWLSDSNRDPDTGELRYAALLAHHLRLDDMGESILDRAARAEEIEHAALLERGVSLDYRRDDEETYPQDWSHERFVLFLRSAPRD